MAVQDGPQAEGLSTPPGDSGISVRSLARPVQEFLRTEAGSSLLLLAAAVVALVWANSPLADAYEDLWATKLSITLGDRTLSEDLAHWVNDGLMVFFFYVVGLEIRRELALGDLRDRRRAAVPAVAALAGMVVPAALYAAINAGGEGAEGWGIVMATDIAFVLGVLALLGSRCPPQLRVFMLTLAIVDDIGAITVIAIFYSEGIDLAWLAAAGGIVVAILVVRAIADVWRGPFYLVAGIALWFATLLSGVHPTIAGVLLGLMTAVHPPDRRDVERAATLARAFRQAPTPETGRGAMLGAAAAVSPNERLQKAIHPWTSYLIVPLFALANAGVALNTDTIEEALTSPITIGIVVGLVLGKALGITAATLGVARTRLGRLPRGVGPAPIPGAATLAGIGFTVSLFVTDLAFENPALEDQAKVGVLAASLLAAVLGVALFLIGARADRTAEEGELPTRLDPPVDPARDRIRGPASAPLTLVEYADFECPFCGEATRTVAELRERFGDRLRHVFRHLPLTDDHPHAQLAAEAVEAAGAQGRFWEMHDRVISHRERLELDDLLGDAQAIGLDVERFAEDLRNGVHVARIAADVQSAERSGAEGTPTFFAGDARLVGPHDADTLAAALEAFEASSPTPTRS